MLYLALITTHYKFVACTLSVKTASLPSTVNLDNQVICHTPCSCSLFSIRSCFPWLVVAMSISCKRQGDLWSQKVNLCFMVQLHAAHWDYFKTQEWMNCFWYRDLSHSQNLSNYTQHFIYTHTLPHTLHKIVITLINYNFTHVVLLMKTSQ